MREIIYKYNSRGLYQTEQDTAFGEDSKMKFIVEPHDFEMKIGGEVLRSTSYGGGAVIVSREGEAVFYDNENKIIGSADKSEKCYREARLVWKQDCLSVEFGEMVTVDHYPNCDGEHDRWGKKWETERSVVLTLKDQTVEVKY